MATWAEILSDAHTEIGAIGAGEALSAENAAWARTKANSLLDQWNAQRCAVYAETFTTETLTANLDPHTLGPTGATWTFTQRPVDIQSISLVYPTDTFVPLTPRDAEWYDALSTPSITGMPTDFFYNPTWPNGTIYFYPVPSQAWDVQIWTRQYLAAITSNTTFTLPPGYREAITLTLACMLAPSYNKQPSPLTLLAAQHARAIIFANNETSPRLQTQDAGIPNGRGPSLFNYLSRSNEG